MLEVIGDLFNFFSTEVASTGHSQLELSHQLFQDQITSFISKFIDQTEGIAASKEGLDEVEGP